MGVGSIATSGLQAALSHMESISNNIANVNTIGYKKSYVNFADIYMGSPNGSGNSKLGMGTRVQSVQQNFSLGRIETSSSGLDISLGRDGYFVQKNPGTGLTSYTRAGRLNFDSNGYLKGFGGVIQGFPATNGVVQNTGTLVDMKLPSGAIPAKATSNVSMGINLDSNGTLITVPFDIADSKSYNFRSDQTIYDSLGNASVASMYYIKTADNTWSTQLAINDTLVGTGSLTFDNTGKLDTSTGTTGISWTPSNGAAPGVLNIDLAGSTQYAGANKFNSQSQDGCPSGELAGCSIDSNGCLNVSYTNGISRIEGQIAIAQFKSNQGLAKSDEMSWMPTSDSGQPMIDPQSSQSGFVSNSIEYSNVDLTEELVNLIEAQHDFQANAQAQQTYNQVLQTIEKI